MCAIDTFTDEKTNWLCCTACTTALVDEARYAAEESVPRTWAEAVSRTHCEIPDDIDAGHDLCGWMREDDSL